MTCLFPDICEKSSARILQNGVATTPLYRSRWRRREASATAPAYEIAGRRPKGKAHRTFAASNDDQNFREILDTLFRNNVSLLKLFFHVIILLLTAYITFNLLFDLTFELVSGDKFVRST